MTVENKKQAVINFYDAWSFKTREKYENIISEKLKDHDRTPMAQGTDFEAMWDLMQSLKGLETKYNIEQIHFLEANKIMIRWQAAAKHVGNLFGMPASNKTAYYAGHDILQLDGNGKISEIWHVEQIFQLMKQLK